MNWSTRTKLLTLLGMIAANVMVVVGWWIVKQNVGKEGPFPITFWSYMGIMDLMFVWFVFIFPSILKKKK